MNSTHLHGFHQHASMALFMLTGLLSAPQLCLACLSHQRQVDHTTTEKSQIRQGCRPESGARWPGHNFWQWSGQGYAAPVAGSWRRELLVALGVLAYSNLRNELEQLEEVFTSCQGTAKRRFQASSSLKNALLCVRVQRSSDRGDGASPGIQDSIDSLRICTFQTLSRTGSKQA
ncbi:uncharacterized protein F5Z01DRAFT_127248 [Emericellopsis atlantica]|uniref:Uncharacterized protein n=1 Tax=Emericellopsis atlantica TaxID=2614577 RepID=A0A9P7ZKE2_9HYPO|nr:uncharacterized protein F5Z01DRAFT_127248 [Emericellopsis atlantica]KAG9253748.1 hypothetical protein F5Z01DRAFT_127248 [Emericellopsis atlantica]